MAVGVILRGPSAIGCHCRHCLNSRINIAFMKTILLLLLLPHTALAELGMASWYGGAHTITSTGKKLSTKTFAVAHRSLPFGTKVKVTSVRTKKSVVAVVEDRGPFTKNRIVDLNKAAAKELGMLKDGVTKVKLEVFELRAKTKQNKK